MRYHTCASMIGLRCDIDPTAFGIAHPLQTQADAEHRHPGLKPAAANPEILRHLGPTGSRRYHDRVHAVSPSLLPAVYIIVAHDLHVISDNHRDQLIQIVGEGVVIIYQNYGQLLFLLMSKERPWTSLWLFQHHRPGPFRLVHGLG